MSNTTKATTISATNFDLPSLHLLRQEIEVTLRDAEIHLSEFNDDNSQAPLLLDSVETLAQLAKVLRLIRLEETAVLAENLAKSLQLLYDNRENTDNELVMDISEGIMVLGRYIEFALLKETIEPSLILPIINKLQERTGEPLLTLPALIDTKTSSIVVANPEGNFHSLQSLGITNKMLISAYRAGLNLVLTATKKPMMSSDLELLKGMESACLAVLQRGDSLFWLSAAAAVTNLADAMPLTLVQKRALIFVEQQFNNYLPINDSRFADLVRFAMTRQNPLADIVRQKNLANTLTPEQLYAMKRFLFGPNREVTDTINQIIQEEIDAIKVASDNYARQDGINSAETEMEGMLERLRHLSLVFKTLNMQEVSSSLEKQIEEVKTWTKPTPENFDKLLEGLMVAENASIYLAKSHTPGAVAFPLHNRQISLHQLESAYTTLVSESRTAIATIENAFNEYSNDEKKEIMHLMNVPDLMRSVSGACYFLGLNQTAQLLRRGSNVFDVLVQNGANGISADQLAKVADIISAADYYLESLEVNKPTGLHAIKMGQRSLQKLMVA